MSLTTEIDALKNALDDPVTGLRKQRDSLEASLISNDLSQKSMTQDRTQENLVYQKDISNLVESQRLLARAIIVLKKFYTKIIESALIQASPSASVPKTWEGSFKGQSKKGGDAIGMLEFILNGAKKEELSAHKAEQTLQHAFEDEMTSLKSQHAREEETLVDIQKTLAEKGTELVEKRRDLKATEKDKQTVETYLSGLKPNCEFMSQNIALRTANRAEEAKALEHARKLIMAMPGVQVESASSDTAGTPSDDAAP